MPPMVYLTVLVDDDMILVNLIETLPSVTFGFDLVKGFCGAD